MEKHRLIAMILYYGITLFLAILAIGTTLVFLYALTGSLENVIIVIVIVFSLIAILLIRDMAGEYLNK